MEETASLITLNSLSSLYPQKTRKLYEHFCSAKTCINAGKKKWIEAVGEDVKFFSYLEELIQKKVWISEIDNSEKQGIIILDRSSNQYPEKLKQLADPPFALYVKGDVSTLHSPMVALVGTRSCTEYGREMAFLLAKEAVELGVVVISGLARGIDTAAHQGALSISGIAVGNTIAIIGSGLNKIYPSENIPLTEQISKKGCIVSELPLNTPPSKMQFPRRNRLVAVLSMGILLVEAPVKSGAMITVQMGEKLRKKCFTIPGRIDYPSFKGNHSLIKQRKALLVENAFEMVSNLNIPTQTTLNFEKNSCIDLSLLNNDEQQLLQLLSVQEMAIDQLTIALDWPMSKVQSALMNLVLKKRIRQLSGNVFKKAS